MRLFQCAWLAQQEQGIAYFLSHLWIAFFVLITRLRLGRIDVALGASGPGVDLALYLVKPLLGFRIVQLVHGPVARSRTIRCQVVRPVIFWEALLLKWKGLDTLLQAARTVDVENRPPTHICYIRPKKTALPVSLAPVVLEAVCWHEAPKDLDQLRAEANIFVSTSECEPFGLSILEAMAAGHCVVIPADGAYWDRILKQGVDCLKYRPGDSADLAGKLDFLNNNLAQIKRLGEAAFKVASQYRASQCYAPIKKALEAL